MKQLSWRASTLRTQNVYMLILGVQEMNSRPVIGWRNPKSYILCAAIWIAVLPLTSFKTNSKEVDDTAPDESIRAFVKLASEMKITKAEMYYCPWGAMSNIPISEESQLTKPSIMYQTTINGLSVFGLVHDVASTLSTFKYKRIQPSKVDFRIGCIFYAKNRQVIRVFISKEEPAVFINGTPFQVTPALVDALLPMLPVQAYREMHRDMISDWASPAYRKNLAETQQKANDK